MSDYWLWAIPAAFLVAYVMMRWRFGRRLREREREIYRLLDQARERRIRRLLDRER